MSDKTPSWHKWIPWLMATSSLVGMLIGQKMRDTALIFPAGSDHSTIQIENKISELNRIINAKHYRQPSLDSLNTWAIEGIMTHLDPYSSYFEKKDETLNQTFRNSAVDFGFDYIRDTNHLLVYRSVVEGIELGDLITGINGIPITNISNLSHEVGHLDSMVIEILRGENHREISVIRQNRSLNLDNSVIARSISDTAIYLKPPAFTKDSYASIMRSIESFMVDQGNMRLLLDLRNNPGGDIEEAIKLINQLFGSKEQEYLRIVYGNGQERDFSSTGKSFFNFNKIAILINHKTASSAEMIAGSLKANKSCKVFGSPSKGKREVQKPFALSDESSLYLTVGKFFFSEEDTIKSEAVVPDVLFEEEQLSSKNTERRFSNWVLCCKEADKWEFPCGDVESTVNVSWLNKMSPGIERDVLLDYMLENDEQINASKAWLLSE